MSEAIRAAAKKWFYESFDCDLLEKMEKAGLIAQAEGFSISVMADLELDMEAAFDRVTAERDALKVSLDHEILAVSHLQQRLTAADERADVLTKALTDVREALGREYWDQYAGLDETRDILDAALKPAEGGGDA